MAKKPLRIRRTFTPQFKQDAVALVAGGRSVNEVAHDLGIARSLVQRWKSQLARVPRVARRLSRQRPPGRRNPYRARMAGSHIVVLEPDVAEVFATASAVNETLRTLAGIIRDQRRPPQRPAKRLSRSRRGSA